jgi:hypothetical protein
MAKARRRAGARAKVRPNPPIAIVAAGDGEWTVLDTKTGKTLAVVEGYANAVKVADALAKR